MENNIKTFDKNNVLGSISKFGNQCNNAWEKTICNKSDRNIKNILVIGMGGSALGAHIIESLNIMRVPFYVSHEYTIPMWVNQDTLVLAVSYSGGTEETLGATREAIAKNAYVVGITAGGVLERILKENNSQVCTIDRNDNPCGQPRYAVGSMMIIILKICLGERLINLDSKNIEDAVQELEDWHSKLLKSNGLEALYENTKTLENKMPLFIYSEHLTNVGRFVRNQIHETGKAFAVTHEIPELNHHLMEGLTFPKSNTENVRVLFFESELYGERNKKRFAITKDVLSKQNISYKSIKVEGESKLSQALITMSLGMYIAYFLALIHQKNPSVVPWVNYFKESLG